MQEALAGVCRLFTSENSCRVAPFSEGMRMGTVVSVRRSDKNPLRMHIEVKTEVDPDRLRQVTLKIDAEAIP